MCSHWITSCGLWPETSPNCQLQGKGCLHQSLEPGSAFSMMANSPPQGLPDKVPGPITGSEPSRTRVPWMLHLQYCSKLSARKQGRGRILSSGSQIARPGVWMKKACAGWASTGRKDFPEKGTLCWMDWVSSNPAAPRADLGLGDISLQSHFLDISCTSSKAAGTNPEWCFVPSTVLQHWLWVILSLRMGFGIRALQCFWQLPVRLYKAPSSQDTFSPTLCDSPKL